MKLFFCPVCSDMVALRRRKRNCYCGQSCGKYAGEAYDVECFGKAIPLSLENSALRRAIDKRGKKNAVGVMLKIMPMEHPSVTYSATDLDI